MSRVPPIALTIAGSDPGGGAGMQADLKTFHQLRVYGISVITLLTVQNTRDVLRVEPVAPDLIVQQARAVLLDLPPGAAKTGALGGRAAIEAVAGLELNCPLVVDPVMISKHGARLLDDSAVAALRELLLPRAALVTPNLHEAGELAGMEVVSPHQMRQAAESIARLGAQAVLVKGGHLEGDALDLFWQNGSAVELRAARVASRHTHGTGCTLSAAICAYLARGEALARAVEMAKAFITAAILTAPGLGAGSGPVNHWAMSDPD